MALSKFGLILVLAFSYFNLNSCGYKNLLSDNTSHGSGSTEPDGNGWSSGGGAIVGDTMNPWFLARNTPTVKYCINIDRENFGISLDTASLAISQAFSYWYDRFEEGRKNHYVPESTIAWTPTLAQPLEAPRFLLTQCDDENVSLTFQLGVLNDNQIRKLKDPRRLIATAQRETYDPINLRGRGFIYVSPQSGALAPRNPRINSDRWTKKSVLKLILAHEIGHTLGFRHDFPSNLMRENMPDTLASVDMITLGDGDYIPSVFTFLEGHSSECRQSLPGGDFSNPVLMKFLEIESDCYGAVFTGDGFEIEGYDHYSNESKAHGSATFENPNDGNEKIIDSKPGVTIYLTEKQKVFPDDIHWADSYSLGTYLKTTMKTVRYRSENQSLTKSFSALIHNNKIILFGNSEGEPEAFTLQSR